MEGCDTHLLAGMRENNVGGVAKAGSMRMCEYNLTHDQTCVNGLFRDYANQKESPAGGWHAQPAPGSGALGTLPTGVLRPIRPGPGEIRDVASALARWGSDHGGMPAVRLQPGRVLSDSASFQPVGIRFVAAAKTRSQRSGQTKG